MANDAFTIAVIAIRKRCVPRADLTFFFAAPDPFFDVALQVRDVRLAEGGFVGLFKSAMFVELLL